MLTSGPLHSWPLGPEHLSPSFSPQPIHPQDCQLCLLNVSLPVPAGQMPPIPTRLSSESSPPSGEAGQDSGPHFTGEKIPTQRERPEVKQGEALRSAPLPSPSPPGQRHFLLLRGLWGPRAAGGAPNGSWGLCVWQQQLGLLGPNPHSECEWEVGEG